MFGLPWRVASSLVFFLPTVLLAQAAQPRAADPPASPGVASARRQPGSQLASGRLDRHQAQGFLERRLVSGRSGLPAPALLRLRGMQQRSLLPHLLPGNLPWQPVGPKQIATAAFGDVTGRVTSVAIASWDASGNTVYLGTTGGGVWRSTNAAANDPNSVAFQPLTDTLSAFSGVNITSLSIGAVSVQPGTGVNGVVLAGTGDPNDALDSYYGAGILRSADGGTTWRLIQQSSDGFSGGITNYSFAGDAFSGFAWSTTSPNLVVAAVTGSFDGLVNNINNSGTDNVAEAGLYYSTDAGQTWFLSTIEDGPNQVIESSQTTIPQVFPGVAVSSVVWNPVRKMFYAAIEYHGYYQSPDGVTWTRLASQPGPALTSAHCPFNTQSNSCSIFRGVLAVQPETGDMFALTVDANNVDQGLWRDVCNAGPGGCANPVNFGARIAGAALEDAATPGTIPQGTYNLALAAVPDGADTLLFAGTQDIFRCSLAAGCVWRNTTNDTSCMSARVAPAQHAIAVLPATAGRLLPLLYFGNDGGLWRSTDGVNETGATCTTGDALHFQNLNGGLGSLAEVTGLANSASDANVLLAGFGTAGSAAATDSTGDTWPLLATGEGGSVAMDPANPENWYAALGPGVEIGRCVQGTSCAAGEFGVQPAIGSAETAGDQSLLAVPYMLDPADSTNMIVGTCRVWRGPASGGNAWSAANVISPMLDGTPEPSCNGNALIRSLAAGGTDIQSATGAESSGSQVIYVGMAGLLDGGGLRVGGHVFSTQTANLADGATPWTDLALSPVANESSFGGVFNPGQYDVSSLYVDPHDPTGETVYATVQGFGVPHLYRSTDGGAHWTNITKNLPDLPLNDVLVDPGDAGVVYVASDGGVFVTQNVENCLSDGGQCWSIFGTGLPMAPATTLVATAADGGLLRVGTYGRGIWKIPLLSGIPQTTMTIAPSSLTFGSQPVSTRSSSQTVTVTNTGTDPLVISHITVPDGFSETNDCGGSIASGGSCQIQVAFAPSAIGSQTGVLKLSANAPSGLSGVSLSGTGTPPIALTILPTNEDFGNQPVGIASAAQQVTVSNTSGAAVSLDSESVTGPFAIQINSCSGSLPAETGCTLAVVFEPAETGPANGILTIASDQGTQTVDLKGVGTSEATDILAPTSLNFSPTEVNGASPPQTVTLTNSGGTALTGITVQTSGDFDVVNQCGVVLAAQASCSLIVRFTPKASGAETGSLIVTDSLRTQTVSLSGTGTAPATDVLSVSVLDFPTTVIGQTAPPATVTLTNSGDAALTGLAFYVYGTGFSQSHTCGVALAAHSSCTIEVKFQPTTAGNISGQLAVSDALRSQLVLLSGSGETPAEDNLSPVSLVFPAQAMGAGSTPQTVVLSNHGQAPLTGIRIESSSPDFSFTTTCASTLPASSSCAIQVTFMPQTAGSDSGILTVSDDRRAQQVSLTGTGVLAGVTLTPTSLDFGVSGIQVQSPAQTLILSNGSSGTLDGIAVSATGPYVESGNCGATLSPAGSCELSVVFKPGVTGTQAGLLTVRTANAGSMSAQLTGVGIAYEFLPTSPTTVSLTSGQSAVYSLEVIPANGSTGSVDLRCDNIPPDSACTVTPTVASLSAGLTVVQVKVTTGLGSSMGRSGLTRRATFMGRLPWPLGLLLVLFSVTWIRYRTRKLPAGFRHLLIVFVVVVAATSLTACGKGLGLLDADAVNPLPKLPVTPPGTYSMGVTASAGGLEKTVNLTLQVQ